MKNKQSCNLARLKGSQHATGALPLCNRKAIEMEYFDKRMALDVIENALTDMSTPHGRGVAAGLCGAFYMCGLLSKEEWETLLKRIPAEHHKSTSGGIRRIKNLGPKAHNRLLN
jgi:hypothetical protein